MRRPATLKKQRGSSGKVRETRSYFVLSYVIVDKIDDNTPIPPVDYSSEFLAQKVPNRSLCVQSAKTATMLSPRLLVVDYATKSGRG